MLTLYIKKKKKNVYTIFNKKINSLGQTEPKMMMMMMITIIIT